MLDRDGKECFESCMSYQYLKHLLRLLIQEWLKILPFILKASQGIFGPWLFIALWRKIMGLSLKCWGGSMYTVTMPVHEIHLPLVS